MSTEAPRIIGIDVARGFAILGMFTAHAIPRPDEAELLVDGRSSILFATLAGVSLGIMTGAERPLERGGRADRVVGIVLRALFLLVFGVLLGGLGSEVAVILDYYGLMFLLVAPVLFLPRWALASIAAILSVAAPAIARAVENNDAGTEPAADFFQYYFLTGYYPVIVWLPFLLAGLICARSGLRRPVTQQRMVLVGGFFAGIGYGAAAVIPGISAEAHSSSTAEVLGSGGLAIAVTGAILWVTAPERRRVRRVVGIISLPIAAIGSMALTVYTLQILTLAIVAAQRDGGGAIDYPGWPLLIGMTLAALVFATLWRRFLGKGPLERLLSLIARPPRSRSRAAPDA